MNDQNKLSFAEFLEKYYSPEDIQKAALLPFQLETLERAARGERMIFSGGLRYGKRTAENLIMKYKNEIETKTVFYQTEKLPKDISPEEMEQIKAEILDNINAGLKRSLLLGYEPINEAEQLRAAALTGNDLPATNASENYGGFSIETLLELKREVEEARKGSEVEINGVKINLLDYEEVSKQNQQFLPAGFRAILNVARTVIEKTENPLPTDLIIFDLNENRALFIGGNRQRWQPFWEQFINKSNYK